MKKIQLPQDIIDEIAKAPRGVIPQGIEAVKKAVTPKEYVSTKGKNIGVTYKKFGPVSVMSKNSTPESIKKARSSRVAEQKAKADARTAKRKASEDLYKKNVTEANRLSGGTKHKAQPGAGTNMAQQRLRAEKLKNRARLRG